MAELTEEYMRGVASGLDIVLNGNAFVLMVFPVDAAEGIGRYITNIRADKVKEAVESFLSAKPVGEQNEGG